MDIQGVQLSDHHQNILSRFVATCEADERIVAAFLVGSYVNGRPDEHSDLDLYLITSDESYDNFVSIWESFVRLLGEPLFEEDFGNPAYAFLIFSDGSEVEINYARESRLGSIFNAPYKVLLDKKNITVGVVSGETHEFNQEEQTKKLRHLVYGFWHDFSHFVTAMARGQLWWAHGQLDVLRSMCVNLARLRNNFSDPDIGDEPYFKIEKAMPVEKLSPLQETFCPMEKDAMLKAGFVIVDFYKELAPLLAQRHGITYPDRLELVMVERLEELRDGRSS